MKQKIALSDLKLNDGSYGLPKNPRFIRDERFKKLVESVRDFPEAMPARGIVVDENSVVLGGNMRVRACRELGMKEIPAEWVYKLTGLTVEQKRRFIIMDNRPLGEDDMDLLANEWDIAELIEAGFDEAELTGLMPDEPQDAEPQIDRAEELNKKWKVKTGDLWQIGEHWLLCGNSTKAEDMARIMGGEKMSLIITSPPYFVGKEYEKQKTEKDIITFISQIAGLCADVIQLNRRIVINCATTAWSRVCGNIDYRLNLDWWQLAFRKKNWFCRSIRIWAKHGGLIHNAPCADIIDMHWEYLATFYNPKAKPYRGQNRCGEGWATSGIWDDIPGTKQTEHSAPFSIEIPSRFIKLYTEEKEQVLDPFLGSGTTMVACQNLNRKCRGIEISPAYCAVVLQRMSDAFLGIKIERIK